MIAELEPGDKNNELWMPQISALQTVLNCCHERFAACMGRGYLPVGLLSSTARFYRKVKSGGTIRHSSIEPESAYVCGAIG